MSNNLEGQKGAKKIKHNIKLTKQEEESTFLPVKI